MGVDAVRIMECLPRNLGSSDILSLGYLAHQPYHAWHVLQELIEISMPLSILRQI